MGSSSAIPISKTALLSVISKIEKEPEESSELRHDKSIASLAGEPGWQALKQTIESEIKRMSEISDSFDPNIDTVESVGFKFLATSLVRHKLQGIIDRVEQTERHIREAGDDSV